MDKQYFDTAEVLMKYLQDNRDKPCNPTRPFKMQSISYDNKTLKTVISDFKRFSLVDASSGATVGFDNLKLTSQGLIVASSEGGYRKFIWEEKNKENPSKLYKLTQKKDTNIKVENLHIGDNFGNYSQSSFSDNEVKNNNTTNNLKQQNKSLLEIASWTAGIIATLIALYEFWLKHYL